MYGHCITEQKLFGYRWLYCGSYINMKKNKKAINTLDYAVEYFDMNYNTGDKKTDHIRCIEIFESCYESAKILLKSGGSFLTKFFGSLDNSHIISD